MLVKLGFRDRTLLGIALNLYEKKAEATKKGCDELNVSSMPVDMALSRLNQLRTELAKTGDELALGTAALDPLRVVAADCLGYYAAELAKLEKKEESLFSPTDGTKETAAEVNRLRRKFSEQIDFEEQDETTIEISSGGETTGPLSKREFEDRVEVVTGRAPTPA